MAESQKPHPVAVSGQDIATAFVAVEKQMRPAVQAIAIWGEQVMSEVARAYLAAGQPYGDSFTGMQRWRAELAEAEQLEREAARIREHHRMMADFRKMLNERRQPT